MIGLKNMNTNKKLKRENLFVHKGLFVPGAKPSEFYEDNSSINPSDDVISSESEVTPVVKVESVQKKYYTIKSGDTLTKIAAKYKTTVSKLCQLNGLKPSSKIQVGKSIRIK